MIKKIRKTVTVCTCDSCGHEWTPKLEMPKVCPECKNPYWNKTKSKKVKKNVK